MARGFLKIFVFLFIVFAAIATLSTIGSAQMFDLKGGNIGQYAYWTTYCTIKSVKPANKQGTVLLVRWQPVCPVCGPYGKIIESYVQDPGGISKTAYHDCSKNYSGIAGRYFNLSFKVYKEIKATDDNGFMEDLPPLVPAMPWNGF